MSESDFDPVLFGKVLAEVERGAEDRRLYTKALERLSDGQDDLRRDLAALNQTVSSTTALVAEIAAERYGIRLKALEDAVFNSDHASHGGRIEVIEVQIADWRRVIGGTKSAIAKLGALLLGSAALQAVFIKWLLEHWH